jgi:putative ABC transport system permease protein
LPGVLRAEPSHIVPADFTVGTRHHRGGLSGVAASNLLQPIHDDESGTDLTVPADGILLGSYLAAKLGVGIGDKVWIDVLEGRRPGGYVAVTDVFETTIAMPAYMNLDALNRWLKQRPVAEYFSLLVDSRSDAELFAKLKEIPAVSAIMVKRAALDAFYETIGAQLLIFITIFTGFACTLGFGVAYNSTRIALSERGRELATLRVLGFTRAEISYVLLGEVAILILAALPVGCLAGRALTLWLARAFDTELFRMPFVIDSSTYGFAVLFALAASAASFGLVRQRLNHLDLIRVLKTRE